MKESEQRAKSLEETKAYLARINRTVAASKELLSQVELRMAETDRILAAQGLTREQVKNLRFTDEQKRAVNEELKRRGLPQMEFDESDIQPSDAQLTGQAGDGGYVADDSKENLENRRRKFNVMMNRYKL